MRHHTAFTCLLFSAALAGLLGASTAAAQQLTEWVQSNPLGVIDKIALGYPVPLPVDTPLPFDGFRTYAGLHARHQDLALTTPWVHPEDIGMTLKGRTIWAYRLGDGDRETIHGLPEPATLTNGGIHAREWQSPETVTAILELVATQPGDDYYYDYLRENVNMIVIPTLNIDGFLQTQRYPSRNYLGVDPDNPASWPRDGRMRRKNMDRSDEDLFTTADLLGGVDLNRNNAPFWNTSNRSSDNPDSLVHHGDSPASEPETRALDSAAQLGPAEQLRLYTDVHSFSQVHFWTRSENSRLTTQTQTVLDVFSTHHQQFDAQKWYAFSNAGDLPVNRGIGSTDEYFTQQYRVPAWTLEIEPTNGQAFHFPLRGCGADYGGEANNCHDGFILPETEIRRVREELAESFTAVYYRQAGPPSILAMRLQDLANGATIQQAAWDTVSAEQRERYENIARPLELGRSYRLWLAFDKPMRWREEGQVMPFPGRKPDTLAFELLMTAGDAPLSPDIAREGWLNEGFEAPAGYLHYRDDAWFVDFVLPDTEAHQAALSTDGFVRLSVNTTDMAGMRLDADPSSVATWADGAWSQYELTSGVPADGGGSDTTLALPASLEAQADPFGVVPGIAGAWYDPSHDGEGFLFEVLSGGVVVVYWFTYDDAGEQDWYIGVGEARGNRVVFPQLLRLSGGLFGDGFDPDLVVEEPVGAAAFTWTDCGQADMEWHIGNRSGRQSLERLTELMGLDCGPPRGAPVTEAALWSGAWYDPDHDGEGYVVEILWSGEALVYWFSYSPDGARRWFFGIGSVQDGALEFGQMLTTVGGVFGDDFDPDSVEELPWGTLRLRLSCEGGTADYTSTEAGFGSGRLDLVRLSQMQGLECPES